jgi:hypothetical protein
MWPFSKKQLPTIGIGDKIAFVYAENPAQGIVYAILSNGTYFIKKEKTGIRGETLVRKIKIELYKLEMHGYSILANA